MVSCQMQRSTSCNDILTYKHIAGSFRNSLKRHPLPLVLPHPGFKGGTFYLAKKRNFLLCVDMNVKT